MAANLDEVISGIRDISDKTAKLVSRTRRLIDVLDLQTQTVLDSMVRIKGILGIDEKLCPICTANPPTHCIDTCHHLYCHACCKKALRAGKCFICRGEVTAMFKVFLN